MIDAPEQTYQECEKIQANPADFFGSDEVESDRYDAHEVQEERKVDHRHRMSKSTAVLDQNADERHIQDIERWLQIAVLYLVAEWLLYSFSSLAHRALEPSFNVLDVSFIGILIQYSGGFRHSMTMINFALFLYFMSVVAVALDFVRSEKVSRVGLYFFALLVSLFWGVYQGISNFELFESYLIALLAFALVFVLVSILASQPRAAPPPTASNTC